MWDMFLSYTHTDLAAARALVDALRRKRLAVWFDLDVLHAGVSLHQGIAAGVHGSRMGVVLATPSYFDRPWPERELSAFLARNRAVITVLHRLTSGGVQERSPILAGASFLPWRGASRTSCAIFSSFSAAGFRACHANHMALIAGAGAGGTHVLCSLLAWGSIPVLGVYDKRSDAQGVDLARDKGIPAFSGSTAELGRMLRECASDGFRGYHFFVFVGSRDPHFRAFVERSVEEARAVGVTNLTVLWMDNHFPDYAPPESLHSLMRTTVE